MCMIALHPIHLRKVKGILARQVPEFEVLVYGSRANGTAKAHSYLDLAVITDSPLAESRVEKLSMAFAGARLPFKVDTVDWAASGKDFRRVIKKTGVHIQRVPAKKR